MKTLLLSTALAAALALPAMSQTAATTTFQAEMSPGAITASDMIGARVYAAETPFDTDSYAGVQDGWNDIGEVNDIILARDGSVQTVLVDIGGFLGMGERQVAVDMASLRFVQDSATDADDWFLVLQADRATLEGAPAWVTGSANTDGAASTTPMTGTGTTATTTDTTTGTGTAATGTATAPMTTAPAAGTDTAAATPGTSPMAREGYASVERATLTAEMLTGADVYDSTDNRVGEVGDLVIAADGTVSDMILDVGGFLGMGVKHVAISLQDTEIMQQADGGEVRIYVAATKDELKALPDFKK
ncbi:MAG: PRC-barrel domain-containing protein [Gemmobacter sp.]|nr:PRC-barrel domain-containing protein [Gemmobacter sp.]